MDLVASRAAGVVMLEFLKSTGGPMNALTVHLFKNDVQVGPGTLTEDLEEADYPGYAPSAVLVWTEAVVPPGETAEMRAASVQFVPVGAGAANVIYGYWLEPATPGAQPFQVVRFDSPQGMGTVYDAIFVEPVIKLPLVVRK